MTLEGTTPIGGDIGRQSRVVIMSLEQEREGERERESDGGGQEAFLCL